MIPDYMKLTILQWKVDLVSLALLLACKELNALQAAPCEEDEARLYNRFIDEATAHLNGGQAAQGQAAQKGARDG